MPVVAEQELVRACHILFGPHLQVSRHFLEYLQPAGIKKAYRKRALETHPDMLVFKNGSSRQVDTALFRQVQKAYEDLSEYLEAREQGFRLTPPPPPRPRRAPGFNRTQAAGRPSGDPGRRDRDRRSRPSGQEAGGSPGNGTGTGGWSANGLYRGPLPNRPLLLGHFLYYSGIINWSTMIQAVVWQRLQRPRMGELARRLGWLSDQEIQTVFQSRQVFERFGDIAHRLGLLTPFQVKVLLFQQRRLQQRLGDFFLENGLLTAAELEDLVCRCHEHNSKATLFRYQSGFTF